MRPPVPLSLGGGPSGAEKRALLRDSLTSSEPLLLPGVVDAMGAVLVERAGFRAVYLTGAGLANTQMAVPDVGLLGFESVVTQSMRTAAVTSLPTVVDVDTGLGGPTAVMHVVRTLESVGVAGIQMEDQEMPKRCGHFDRKRVVPSGHMQAKIQAALTARSDPNMIVIARTDAVAVEGIESAIERGKAYRDAGADVVFVEAPDEVDQIERIPREIPDVPLLINIVQGGRTPELGVAELADLGYQVVLHANLLMRSMVAAGQQALADLKTHGTRAESGLPFLSWQERQQLVRLPEFDALEDHFMDTWAGPRDTAQA